MNVIAGIYRYLLDRNVPVDSVGGYRKDGSGDFEGDRLSVSRARTHIRLFLDNRYVVVIVSRIAISDTNNYLRRGKSARKNTIWSDDPEKRFELIMAKKNK